MSSRGPGNGAAGSGVRASRSVADGVEVDFELVGEERSRIAA